MNIYKLDVLKEASGLLEGRGAPVLLGTKGTAFALSSGLWPLGVRRRLVRPIGLGPRSPRILVLRRIGVGGAMVARLSGGGVTRHDKRRAHLVAGARARVRVPGGVSAAAVSALNTEGGEGLNRRGAELVAGTIIFVALSGIP